MSIVKVNQEKCIGCGACVAIDPENFDFNDDGISTVINEVANDKTKEAEEVCPVCAIDIIDEVKVNNEESTQASSDESQDNMHSEAHKCCDDDCDCEDECDCDECDCCENECDCDECDCCHSDDCDEEDSNTKDDEENENSEKGE